MGGRGGSFIGGRSRGSTLASNNKLYAAITQAEAGIKNNNFETAIVFDDNGNIVLNKKGGKHSVSFDANESAKMQGKVLTHNHPNGTTFSRDDINSLVKLGLKSIRATSTNRTYELRQDGSGKDAAAFSAQFQHAQRVNQRKTDKLYKQYKADYSAGKIKYSDFARKCNALDEQWNSLNSDWLAKNAKTYGYDYIIS